VIAGHFASNWTLVFGQGEFFIDEFLGGDLCNSEIVEVLPHLFGGGNVNCTREIFFLCDSGLRQIFDNRYDIDPKFASQLVNADLIRLARYETRCGCHVSEPLSCRYS
jgi:hypothetical protein